MKLDRKLMKSKVAQRIFLQFVLCALLPIVGLAIISFTQVKEELKKQGQSRLHEASRSLGTAIYERLTLLQNDLNMISMTLPKNLVSYRVSLTQEYLAPLEKRFKALALSKEPGRLVPLFGEVSSFEEPSLKEMVHLRSGKALVKVRKEAGNTGRIYMLKLVDSRDPERGLIVGEVNGMYLWGLSENNTLPAMTELAVLDKRAKVIFSTHPFPPPFYKYPEFHRTRSSISHFEWEHKGEKYQAGFWSVYMRYHWLYPRLTVVLSSPNSYIFAPIAYFKKIFPLVILLSLWVVLFLSAVQINRTTRPIAELKESSKRIAMRDFSSRVNIRSGDEFQELGSSFNNMANQLGKQFSMLNAVAEIDRGILSSLKTEEIVDTLISGIKSFFKYDMVSVSLFDQKEEKPAWYYTSSENPLSGTTSQLVKLPLNKLKALVGHQTIISFSAGENIPDYFSLFLRKKIQRIVLLPLFIKEALVGIIILGARDPNAFEEDDLALARQLANQVAVALSNARLLEELDELNWGTLYALARAVDAKSPWTANHSERVTDMALKIGKVMGLGKEELENLRRGALLHDIGKISIPVSVLDKNGALSDDELHEIRSHPEVGARILEPISAYAPVIPIVLQHHEHFDGTGYPAGIAGNKIDLGARILAAADVYDALSSDRPYRTAKPLQGVIEILKQEAGRHFDPNVVRALLIVIKKEKEIQSTAEKEVHII